MDVIAQNVIAIGVACRIPGESVQLRFGIDDKGRHGTLCDKLRLFRNHRQLHRLANRRQHLVIQVERAVLDLLQNALSVKQNIGHLTGAGKTRGTKYISGSLLHIHILFLYHASVNHRIDGNLRMVIQSYNTGRTGTDTHDPAIFTDGGNILIQADPGDRGIFYLYALIVHRDNGEDLGNILVGFKQSQLCFVCKRGLFQIGNIKGNIQIGHLDIYALCQDHTAVSSADRIGGGAIGKRRNFRAPLIGDQGNSFLLRVVTQCPVVAERLCNRLAVIPYAHFYRIGLIQTQKDIRCVYHQNRRDIRVHNLYSAGG